MADWDIISNFKFDHLSCICYAVNGGPDRPVTIIVLLTYCTIYGHDLGSLLLTSILPIVFICVVVYKRMSPTFWPTSYQNKQQGFPYHSKTLTQCRFLQCLRRMKRKKPMLRQVLLSFPVVLLFSSHVGSMCQSSSVGGAQAAPPHTH